MPQVAGLNATGLLDNSFVQVCLGLGTRLWLVKKELRSILLTFSRRGRFSVISWYLSICSFIAFCTRSCLPFSEPNIAANAGGETES